MAWAAMLVCALGTGGVWLYEASQGQSPLLAQTVEVPEGVKQRMVLADGTKVWLNSGSRLTLDAGFGQTNRGLQLEGEGMFEVAKDGRYVGTVSEGDFLRCILDRKDNSLRTQEKLPLITVMRQGFNPAVSIRVSMAELLDRAMRQSFIPVVDDRGAFMGIVTRQSIMRKLVIPAVEKDRQADRQPERELEEAMV